jgi:hypothetical protein
MLGLDAVEKINKSHAPTGTRTPDFEPVSRRYTDWAIPTSGVDTCTKFNLNPLASFRYVTFCVMDKRTRPSHSAFILFPSRKELTHMQENNSNCIDWFTALNHVDTCFLRGEPAVTSEGVRPPSTLLWSFLTYEWIFPPGSLSPCRLLWYKFPK